MYNVCLIIYFLGLMTINHFFGFNNALFTGISMIIANLVMIREDTK